MSGVMITNTELATSSLRRASGERALAEHRARTEPRFYLKSGDLYLHWSGTVLTNKRVDAYIGSATQAANIRKAISLAAQCKPVEA